MIESRVSANGVRINVAQGGNPAGPLMFFMHGIASWWQTFARILPAFATDYGVACTDLRGCGLSDRGPTMRYTLDEYVEDNASVLKQLLAGQSRKVVFAGHSYGGLMALALAARFPALAHSVVAIDPPFFFREHGIGRTTWPYFFGRVLQLLRDGRDADGVVALLRQRLPGAPDPELRERAGHLLRLDTRAIDIHVAGESVGSFDLNAVVANVRCPVLVLHGDEAKHGAVRASDLAWLPVAMPQVQLVRFAGAGHVLHETHADAVAQAAAQFLVRQV